MHWLQLAVAAAAARAGISSTRERNEHGVDSRGAERGANGRQWADARRGGFSLLADAVTGEREERERDVPVRGGGGCRRVLFGFNG